MINFKKIILLILFCALNVAWADFKGFDFTHKDWEISCDNTGTCRAAAYHTEQEDDKRISVLFTREAGKNAPVRGKIVFSDEDDTPQKYATLWIDGQDFGVIRENPKTADATLNQKQIHALIQSFKKPNGEVKLLHGKHIWRLSGEGANAVLLKMDAFQGRVNTPSALMKMGKNQSLIPNPQAMPTLKIAPTSDKTLVLNQTQKSHLIKQLKSLVNADTCHMLYDDMHSKMTAESVEARELDKNHILINTFCWRGAYNESFVYALTDKHLKNMKIVNTMANDYEKGILSAAHKSRGLGDCWHSERHIWNGQTFVLAEKRHTGMCRGFAGGAWDFPTYQSKMVR